MTQQPSPLPAVELPDTRSGVAALSRIPSQASRSRSDHFVREGSGLELEFPGRTVFPTNWVGHAPFAFWLIEAMRPRMVVELGVHSGNSYCAFAQAIRTLGIQSRCFGIDHWAGDRQASFYGDDVYNELRAYHDPRYATFSTLLRSSFDDALSSFSDGSIDLLHIDGYHTYEAVAHDFKAWAPKMSSRGVVLFHDISVRERDFGVWRLWEEVSSRYPSFELHHSFGLGAIYVGSEPLSERLRPLFEAGADSPFVTEARAYFARLGAGVSDRCELQEALQLLEKAQREVGQLRSDVSGSKLRAVLLRRHAVVIGRERLTRRELEAEFHRANIAEQEVASLKSSTSWRITAPLRGLSLILRSLAGGVRRLRGLRRPENPAALSQAAATGLRPRLELSAGE